MSDYTRLTRHPLTGHFSAAHWSDNYFGPHRYGVQFDNDPVIYPAEQVNESKLKTLWFEDVVNAIGALAEYYDKPEPTKIAMSIEFLNMVEKEYKARWKRDPDGGEGAVTWLASMRDGADIEE